MLSSEVKALISAVVELYSTTPLIQALIDEGVNKLTEAKNLLLSQKEQPSYPTESKYKKWILNPIYADNLIENNFINASNGKQQVLNKYKCSDFIEIPQNVTTVSIVSSLVGDTANHIFALYDENKKFIKGAYKSVGYDWNFSIPNNADYDHIDYEIPENSKYIRFSSDSSGNIYGGYYLSDTPESFKFIHEGNSNYEVDTVSNMKLINAKPGDVIITKGYNSIGDLGNGIYDVMTYDEFHYMLPNDIKLIDINGKPSKTPVDGFGNHLLNNGLVAKLRVDCETRPEQWGAISTESFNSCQSFVHMFAHIKTGTIKLKKDGVYCLGMIYNTDTISNFKDNPYKKYMTGSLLGGQSYSKPIMANIKNVEIIGDNTTITIPNNVFGSGGMGILNFGGKIDGIKISGINFDGKGRFCNYPNKNSNHTIFYAPASFTSNHPSFKELHPLYNNVTNSFEDGCIHNFEVRNCNFFDAGAMYKSAGDAGGDFILLVPAVDTRDIVIEDNTFKAWGRWVFAIDLGGNRERIYNIKFNNNICIGANATNEDGTFKINTPVGLSSTSEDYWRWRALGFIDFETRKCFSNVEIANNYIDGSAGFAINGASQISDNFKILNNIWNHCGGGYPYLIEFYSGEAENWTIQGNDFVSGGGAKIGIASKDIYVKYNTGDLTFRAFGIDGDIIFENNKKNSKSDMVNYHKGFNLDGTATFSTVEKENRRANFVWKNNDYGLMGSINWNQSHIHLDIHDNNIDWMDVINFYKEEFDPCQLKQVTSQMIRLCGLKGTNPIPFRVTPSLYYEKGDIIYSSITGLGVINGDFYLRKEYYTDIDISKFGNTMNFNSYVANVGYDCKMVCTKSGVIPSDGRWGFSTGFSGYYDYGTQYTKIQGVGAFIYTEDNLYYVTDVGEKGTLGDKPTHTTGEEMCGECKLKYVAPIGRITLERV